MRDHSSANKINTESEKKVHDFNQWIEKRLPFFSIIQKEYIQYPMPRNLNIWWTFGAVLSVVFLLMVITGIFLTLYYTASSHFAFSSVEAIERRVPSGWLIRAMHMAGSNLFLAFLYLHLFRSLYYGSYKAPRELVWCSGLVLMLMVMMTAFAGYILPWGQMSYWAANVVMQALSSIPLIGKKLSIWLMGGEMPNSFTLHRYYTLHFVMAFLIFAAVAFHIICFHYVKSNNPAGIEPKVDKETLPFYPYFVSKDGVVIACVALIMIILVCFFPELLTNTENYIPANRLETPDSIAPEWYFLPFYGVLQIIPSKFGGLVLSIGMILLLFIVPWLDRSSIKSARYRSLHRLALYGLVVAFIMLGVVGKYHNNLSILWLGRIALFYYYLFFLIALPFLNRFEPKRTLPISLLDNKG